MSEGFSTRAIHAGQPADPATGAVITPIYQTSTYVQEEIGRHKGYEYSRTGNPTRAALESCLAALEGGEFGLAYSSGLAATDAVLATLRPGDHIIVAEDLYGGTYRMFENIYRPRGLDFTYVDGRRVDAFADALRPETRLIWIETPTNPLLHLVDIAAVAVIATQHGALLAVDNTFATPYLQRPLALGAHVVVYSVTKYLGGHSDVVGGALITGDRTLYDACRYYQNAAGAVPGPFDAWLTLRGIKTLAVRMDRHNENAMRVARFLRGHPAVQIVYYPGLDDHPQHDLASRQMAGYGGMVSFDIAGGREAANAFLKNLTIFSLAESLGGVESLACYPAEMTHAAIPEEERLRRGITTGLIRLSVGIEDVDDLLADLERGFDAVKAMR
ncbi:MAG TPA: cystathionine gamma-synthase [Chloroflexi bacterium]|jgi:cystathionine gamma-lyase|nr:cystathionine gamma-synthase [Chloroflexota bacterium]